MANFDSSITAHFGGDTSGLAAAVTESETLVAGLEKRFDQMGISIGEAPKKFASESAKAFEEVFNAEGELAAYREKVAFDRMSNEEKLAALQGQAVGILHRIGDIEGETVEKKGLQLEFEKKKTGIFELHQKIAKENVAEQGKLTEEGRKQTKEYHGFTGVLDRIKDGFKAIGISLKGAGLGIAIAAAVKFTRDAVNEAQNLRDEYEKMAKPLDAGTAALARMGDGIDVLKKGLKDGFSTILKDLAQIGEHQANIFNRSRGITDEQVKLNEQIARGADYQQERAKQLRLEQFDREKIRAMAKEVADAERKYGFERMDTEGQVNALIERNIRLRLDILAVDKDSLKYQELRKQLAESNLELTNRELAAIKERFDLEIANITKWAPLAQSVEEQRAIIKKQQAVLLAEINQLSEKGYKTAEAQAKLDALSVQSVQLETEYADKMRGDREKRLEIARLELKSKTGLTDEENAQLKLLRLQLQEEQTKLKVNELLGKYLDGTMKPEQEELLKKLEAQLLVIGLQKEEMEKIVAGIKGGFKPAVESITTAVDAQSEAWDKITGRIKVAQGEAIKLQGIIAGIATSSNFGDETTDVLQERVRRNNQKIKEIEIGMTSGPLSLGANAVDKGEVARLKLENNNLQREIDLRKKIVGIANKSGEDAALKQFPGDPAAFDRFLDIARGQDSKIGKVEDNTARILNLLRDITKR